MAAICVAPIKARVMRLIKVNECGAPVSGVGSAVSVFGGFISVAVSPQYEEGTEYIQKTANGDLCVNDKDPNELKRVNLTITLCTIDPDMIAIVTSERLLTTGAPATGTGVAYGEGTLTGRYSLELWQPISGAGACAPGGLAQYMYWLFGNVGNTMVGDWTFEQGVMTFNFTSETKSWYTAWPTSIGALTTGLGTNVLLAGEHYLHNVTTVAPPTAVCGAVPL
jgi:hypothetical protein